MKISMQCLGWEFFWPRMAFAIVERNIHLWVHRCTHTTHIACIVYSGCSVYRPYPIWLQCLSYSCQNLNWNYFWARGFHGLKYFQSSRETFSDKLFKSQCKGLFWLGKFESTLAAKEIINNQLFGFGYTQKCCLLESCIVLHTTRMSICSTCWTQHVSHKTCTKSKQCVHTSLKSINVLQI